MSEEAIQWDGLTFGFESEEKETPEIKSEKKNATSQKRRKTECLEQKTAQIYRRAFSETQLLDVVPKVLKENHSYNFITAGDVDALSYLKIIIRNQNIKHCLLSTWVMACHDILEIEKYLNEGKIKHIDFYMGEVFPNQYKNEFKKLKTFEEKYKSKVVVFKNHSKIFAGTGDKFSFGIQTSANVNTNPRTENGCITINDEIYKFYKSYFEGIKSFI